MDQKPFVHLFDSKRDDVDETAFYFKSDPDETERFIGFLPEYDKPYWVGYCDIKDGCEFKTAKELFEAPIYDGKSLKDRWDDVVLYQIGGISATDWEERFKKETSV